MRKTYAAALLSAASWAAMAHTATATDLYVFGDSLSDNGNYLQVVPPWGDALYPLHFSTGPVWVEHLGFNLGRAPGLTTLQAPEPGYLQGYGFAHGAATANRSGPYLPTGAPNNYWAQANFFAQSVQSGAIDVSRNDIAIAYFGTNDFLTYDNSTIPEVVAAIKTHSRTVLNQGVGTLLVMGMPDWGASPFGSMWGNNPAEMSYLTGVYNTALAAGAAELRQETGKKVAFVDVDGLFKDMIARPRLYGLTVTGIGPNSNGSCVDDGYNWQTCPDGYMFADALHWSGRSNRVLANFVLAKTNGLFAGSRNTSTAKQSTALLATMLVTAAQDLISYIRERRSSSSFALAAPTQGQQGGYSVMLTSEGGALPHWMAESDDRFALFGRSAPISENLTVGFASIGGQGEHEEGHGSSKLMGTSGFAAWRDGGWTVTAAATSQSTQNEVWRETGFEYYPIVAARFDARTDVAAFSAARTVSVGGWTVTPVAEVLATRVTTDGYRETNAPSFLAETIETTDDEGVAAGARLTLARTWVDREGGGWAVSLSGVSRTALSGAPRELADAPLPELARALANAQGDARWLRADMERSLASGWTMGLAAAGAQTSAGDEAFSARLNLNKRF